MCGSERFIIIKQVLTQSSFSRIIFRTNYIGSWFSRNNFLANNKNRRTKLVKIVSIESVLCSASHKILWSQRICTPPFGTTNLRNPYHYKAWKKNWNVIILQSSLCRQYFEPPSLTTHKHGLHETRKNRLQIPNGFMQLLAVECWCMDYGWYVRWARVSHAAFMLAFHNYFSVVFNQARCQLDFIGFPFFPLFSVCSVAMRTFNGSFYLLSNGTIFCCSPKLTQVMNTWAGIWHKSKRELQRQWAQRNRNAVHHRMYMFC